jgi:hypothetical protein
VSQADQEEPLLPPARLAELLEALEAAWRPAELDSATNERLIEMALEDPLAPATEEELAESARLRDALEQGAPHEAVATLAVLRAAFEAGDASEPLIESSVNQAVHEALHGVPAPSKQRQGNVIFAVFGASSAALAAAALLLLFVGTPSRSAREQASVSSAEPSLAAGLARPRSTAPLFSERFETEGTTARMDAIASARSRDLRDNRFASWGVK